MTSLWQQAAQATWVEALKARRSKLPLFTGLGISLLPLVGGLFMIIIRDPEIARRAGLISAKAQILTGSADWGTYLNFLAQGAAVGGFVLCSIILTWVFGREHSDRTLKDLLALPTSRSAIVLAKFIVFLVWSVGLMLIVCLLGLLVGAAVRLPPVPASVIVQGMLTILAGALMAIIVTTPVALAASAGRGYLAAVGVTFLLMLSAQVLAILGWGEYFPWSIPAVYAAMPGEAGVSLGAASYLIVIVTGAAGVIGALLWWELADQSR
jgi:ABC-2 type transport system permease protein